MYMLTIRLKRVGRKNDPSFRVVLVESARGPQTGKVNEYLGSYNARQKTVHLEKERIDYWLSKGAQASDTVRDLLKKQAV